MKVFQGVKFDWQSPDGCINYEYIPTEEELDALQLEEDEATEDED